MLIRSLTFLLSIADDLLYLGGAVAIVVGVSMIYVPAGWITAGVLCIVGGVFVARYVPDEEKPEGTSDVPA